MSEDSPHLSQLKSGFEEFYQNRLLPQLSGMEKTRKKYFRFFIIGIVVAFIIVPLICLGLLWIFLQQNNGNFTPGTDLPFGLIFFGLLVLIAIVSSPILLYKRKAKDSVMPEFIKYFGNFHYEYQHYIDNMTLNKSLLFGEYNHHQGDDFFAGSYQNVGMIISEEKLQKIESREKGVNIKDVFSGIIILLAMNKNFSGQTVVLKDKGILNIFNGVMGLQRVVLEDSVFEKEFEVFATDQLEARYLLTTAFMERMLKVREAYKSNKIQFGFFDNYLLIAINTKKNMFETTSLFRSCTNRKMIDETFEQFTSIMAIIDILKLNQRTGM